jgi:phosphoribosylformylglycinamidine synthase
LLGDSRVVDSSIGSSEYLELVHGMIKGNPYVDLELEKRLHRCCLEAIRRGIINSAHDCSEGGLGVALAESCLANGLGFVSHDWRTEGRLDSALFGEAQSRIIVSVAPKSAWKMDRLAVRWQIAATRLGTVGGKRLVLKGCIDLSIDKMQEAWWHGLERLL